MYRILEVHDLQVRHVPEIVDFCPKHGYAATYLDIANLCGSITTTGRVDGDYLLSLVIVRDMSFVINTTLEIPSSRTEARASTNQCKMYTVSVNNGGLYVEGYENDETTRARTMECRSSLPYNIGRINGLSCNSSVHIDRKAESPYICTCMHGLINQATL